MKGVVIKVSKRLLGVALAFALLLLTGCGKESNLHCTATESGVNVGFNVKFMGKRITDMNVTYDMNLSSYNDVQIAAIEKQDFCEIVKTSMSQYKDAFTNCSQNVANKNLHVNADLDINKIAKNELEKFSSVSDAKEGLESVGYTCTVD
jgi:hypothetical protein